MTAGPSTRTVAVAVVWLGLTWLAVLVPGLRESSLRAVLAVPATLVLPGYAVVAALFPGGDNGPTAVERAALAVAASLAVCLLLGVGLLVSPAPLTPVGALLGVSAVTVGGLGVARRRSAPRPDGADAPALGDLRETLRAGGLGAAVAGLVVVSAVAGGGGAVVLLGAHDPPGYAEFAVLPPDDGRSLSTAAYREAAAADRPLRVRVTNHHDRTVRYAVVAVHQRAAADGELAAIRSERFTASVGTNETWTVRHRPGANATGRVVYRLHRGDDGPRVATAHVWLNATDTGGVTG